MTDDRYRHHALDLLGVPPERHAAVFAICDQIDAWKADHPGGDALAGGECDGLFRGLGALVADLFVEPLDG